MITQRNASAVVAVVLFAAVVRLVWWRLAGGPIEGGDSSRYLEFASHIAQGDLRTFGEWPFHQLYSLGLVPMFFLPIAPSTYLLLLHVAVSTATVLLTYFAAAHLLGGRYGLVAAAAASVYVPFLFWMPYILTETVFLFAVALYTWASFALLRHGGIRRFFIWIAAAAVFVVARPSGPPVAAATFTVLAGAALAQRYGPRVGALTVMAMLVAVLGASILALSSPGVRGRILRMPTVVQSLWASTKVTTGNMADARAFGALDEHVDRMFIGAPPEAKITYKVNEALGFIRAHPGRYLGMAVRKVVAFWFPWAFTDEWSLLHRAIDAVLTVGLTIGFVLALWTPVPRHILCLVAAFAFAFAILSAFSQIDPDARYRLPAELPVLLIAPAGWLSVLARISGWAPLTLERSR